MVKLCDIDPAAEAKLPPGFPDGSGIGVHYVDAFIRPMNTTLPDGTTVVCKRRGLKVVLAVGAKKGEGLMRRLEVGKSPVEMLRSALVEAATNAGCALEVRGTDVWIRS